MKALRIAAVTSSFPRYDGDHAGRFVQDLHAALVRRGHDVTTLCPAARGAPPEEQGPAGRVRRLGGLRKRGLDVFYGDGLEAQLERRPWALATILGFVRRARQVLLDAVPHPELLLAHWLVPAGWAVASARRRLATAALGLVHGGDAFVLGRPLVGLVAALPLRGGFDGVLCTSRAGEERVRRRLGPLRSVVAPMGVPAPAVDVAGAPLELPERYVLGAGRLIPIKGFDVLVRAAARLPVPVVIAGDGPERRSLEALAAALHAPVRFVGTQPHDELLRAMASAAAVAVPSRVLPGGRTEGTPRVAIEAAALGTPVVASAVGGLADHWPSSALVAPEDPAALARALEAAIAGPAPWPRPARPLLDIDGTAEALLSLLA